MSVDPKKLLDESLQLSPRQRADLAAQLIDSLDGSVDPDATEAWDREIARRTAEIDRGEAELVPWPELRKRLMGRADDIAAA